jgi:hypothetical protein
LLLRSLAVGGEVGAMELGDFGAVFGTVPGARGGVAPPGGCPGGVWRSHADSAAAAARATVAAIHCRFTWCYFVPPLVLPLAEPLPDVPLLELPAEPLVVPEALPEVPPLGEAGAVLELLPELPMPVPEAPVPVLLLSRSQAANAVPATIATATAMILLFIAISPVR